MPAADQHRRIAGHDDHAAGDYLAAAAGGDIDRGTWQSDDTARVDATADDAAGIDEDKSAGADRFAADRPAAEDKLLSAVQHSVARRGAAVVHVCRGAAADRCRVVGAARYSFKRAAAELRAADR